MRTIMETKEKIERYKEMVLRNINRGRKDLFTFENITLLTVEENIALWKVNHFFEREGYIYTDLNGKSLFNGKIFSYATAFSNSRACVSDVDQWYILDLKNGELVSFPKGLYWENINGFRNDELALFHSQENGWGSYVYHPIDHTFTKKIPFIWDTLEISRKKGQVYVGILTDFIYDLLQEEKGYHKKSFLDIPVMPLSTKDAFDSLKYHELMEIYRKDLLSKNVKHILKQIHCQCTLKRIKEVIQRTIMDGYSITDEYFKEQEDCSFNGNDGLIVDTKDIRDYQKKIGKMY